MEFHSMTVREIMNIAPFDGAEILFGREGLHRPVTAVTVLDSPDGVLWLKGGEIVITSGHCFKDDPAVQAWVAGQLVKLSAAALGIKLGRHLWEVPPAIIEAAEAHDLPIISLPYNPSWADFIYPVTKEIVHKQALELTRSRNVYQTFRKLLGRGGSLQDLTDVMSDLVDNPVTIVVPYGATVLTWHRSGCRVSRDALADFPDPDKLEQESTVLSLNSEARRLPASDGAPSRVVVPILEDDVPAGRIIVSEVNREVSEWDLVTIEHGIIIGAFLLKKHTELLNIMRQNRSGFLQRLIRAEIDSEEAARVRAHNLGWAMAKHHYVLAFNTLTCSEADSSTDVVHVADLLAIAENVGTVAKRPPLVGVDPEGNIVAILPTDESGADEAVEIAEAVVSAARRNDLEVRCGISRRHAGLEGLPTAHAESTQALRLCLTALADQDYTLFNNIGVFRLFTNISGATTSPDAYVQQCLGPLLDENGRGGTGLVETLKAYVASRGQIRMTARQLFVHPNTIRYRLELIQEATGLDPREADDYLELHLAVKLLEAMGDP